MSTPSNPMTTENSVRVPRAAIAELLGGTRDEIDEMAKRTGYSRFPSPEQLRGWRCVIDSAIHHLAAPAPAGSLPEQGAGLQTLADEWAHAIRNGVMDDGEGDGPMFYATEEWALNMLESIRALARQQSRVVDWPSGVLNKSDTLAVIKQHNAWRRGAEGPQTDPRMLGLALDAVIAALEGDRDGR